MKLGLIGKAILHSSSPDLHVRLGKLTDIATTYDLFDANEAPIDSLEDKVSELIAAGYRGVNVTYPFKERAVALASSASEGVRMVGSSNTLVFEANGIHAENTDFTGFMSGYRATLGERSPGRVLLIGTGGVGKAAAFGVARLGASEVLLVDLEAAKAEQLAEELRRFGFSARAVTADDVDRVAPDCDGLVNCTPIGHEKSPGCPLAPALLRSHHWIFDAVYVPAVTEFVAAARQAGASVMSGVSLFVFQGVDAFKHFCEDERKRAAADEQAASLFAHYRRELLKENP
ncbi:MULTISPECIES: saccharopine dehydrogenase NADP-binding domain-containing protein [unclassified Halomonas]|uniref:shikimate dehydrogenase family protein n=1 Tax=unclassified Halomonas TaxID=2609666 RepID=UPI0020970BE6|nr:MULTISPECIES: saccharopine dehydrogenase NADP-binding domain-containing protein [unclassified Halomonas]MCJ8284479.1 saccharopine dehydrogenase NADP-binding domain-containing protein [Halomonas sp.]MCO7216205.1 saccharopine dehydrogenase NADP-binding domain-containing protein [Halomonas sp. OfavH-34-E]NQY69533.1 saccharopine dehydrogenase NADP-binding domain-containing protein [Halomonas sp.]